MHYFFKSFLPKNKKQLYYSAGCGILMFFMTKSTTSLFKHLLKHDIEFCKWLQQKLSEAQYAYLTNLNDFDSEAVSEDSLMFISLDLPVAIAAATFLLINKIQNTRTQQPRSILQLNSPPTASLPMPG